MARMMKNMATNAKIKEIEKKRQAAIAKGEAVRDDDAPPVDPSSVSEPEFQFNLTAYVKRGRCCAAAAATSTTTALRYYSAPANDVLPLLPPYY